MGRGSLLILPVAEEQGSTKVLGVWQTQRVCGESQDRWPGVTETQSPTCPHGPCVRLLPGGAVTFLLAEGHLLCCLESVTSS